MKDIRSLGVNTEDVIDWAVLWWNLGFHVRSLNSAEGGTLFLCFLFHRMKAITVQTMSSKAAPVTPIAIAATFNDLPRFMEIGLADVSVELALVGEGVDESEESVRERGVEDWCGGGEVGGYCPILKLQWSRS